MKYYHTAMMDCFIATSFGLFIIYKWYTFNMSEPVNYIVGFTLSGLLALILHVRSPKAAREVDNILNGRHLHD